MSLSLALRYWRDPFWRPGNAGRAYYLNRRRVDVALEGFDTHGKSILQIDVVDLKWKSSRRMKEFMEVIISCSKYPQTSDQSIPATWRT